MGRMYGPGFHAHVSHAALNSPPGGETDSRLNPGSFDRLTIQDFYILVCNLTNNILYTCLKLTG